ncbi:hypothetical protein NLM33_10740 [Bradyrhizobium sp. CCGUVB1N3]|nr:hypothetical protein [Bradyrhizobium sp. CCGUVB1N3]MCP3470797.1 hypothetical protein [Bradyrhizobium sp. CCGUVB1N3]
MSNRRLTALKRQEYFGKFMQISHDVLVAPPWAGSNEFSMAARHVRAVA